MCISYHLVISLLLDFLFLHFINLLIYIIYCFILFRLFIDYNITDSLYQILM
jgi:hypothetical protein